MVVETIMLQSSDDEMIQKDTKILTIVGSILIILFALNLALLLFNTFRYLIPLRIKSALLALFYILAAINNLARLLELVFFVVPDKDGRLPNLTRPDRRPQQICEAIATCANIMIGLLFVATMYQIASSIQMIDNPMVDLDRARRNKLAVYISAAMASVIISCMIFAGLIVFK